MLKLKRVKPIGCQVLVTENLYGWDDFDESGLIIHKRGDLKTYQEVISVGEDVKWVKPGDVVEINYYKYCQFENDENSVKVNGSNKIVSINLNEIELEGTDTLPYTDFQYRSLEFLTLALMRAYPDITPERITGHQNIAPERKTDPGPSFDWKRFKDVILSPGRNF